MVPRAFLQATASQIASPRKLNMSIFLPVCLFFFSIPVSLAHTNTNHWGERKNAGL